MARSRLVAVLVTAMLGLALLLFVPTPAGAAPTSVRACDATPAAGHVTCFALRSTDVRTRAATSGLAGYGPGDLASAYGLPSGRGTGQTVYVVDAYDDPNAETDLATYRAQYGLPACTSANGCFRKLNVGGTSNYFPEGDAGWAAEDSLDLDTVSAICPQCGITLVEAESDGEDDLFKAVDTAVRLGAHFVSMSWGAPESGYEPLYDKTFDHPGVVFTAATGDLGYDGGANYPASSPFVVAVGGTQLHRNDYTPRGWDEETWSLARTNTISGTGSGCSRDEAKPSYQVATVPASTCARRAEADISADAAPETGLAVYDSYDADGWSEMGGTSLSSPLIAAMYALAGAPAAVAPQRSLYAAVNTSALNDVTRYSNGSCPQPALCTAGAGWDGPTGVGTPEGLTAFAGTPPAAGAFQSVTPTRLLDTRSGIGGAAGTVPADRSVTLQVAGAAGVPVDGVSSVVLSLVSTGSTASGYLTAYPAGTARPATSNVNYGAGQTTADSAVIPVGADGQIVVYTSARTDLVADVSGYYLAGTPTSAGAFSPLTSSRLLDTRDAAGPTGGARVATGGVIHVAVAGRGGVPTGGVGAAMLTVAATRSTAGGYVTAYADGTTRPGTSNVNFRAGKTSSNLLVAPATPRS